MLVSGAEARRRQQPDLYRSLLNSKHDAELVEMIKSGESAAQNQFLKVTFSQKILLACFMLLTVKQH